MPFSEAEKIQTQGRRPCDGGGRNGSDAATGKGFLGSSKAERGDKGSSSRDWRQYGPVALSFQTSGPQTVSVHQYISVVLSQQFCGTLLRQLCPERNSFNLIQCIHKNSMANIISDSERQCFPLRSWARKGCLLSSSIF